MVKTSTWSLVIRTIALSFLFSLLALLPLLARAEALNINSDTRMAGFVTFGADRSLYVDYLKPLPGQPTVVLINGLTYNTECWDKFVNELKGHGFGILRYDPMGMGETLLKHAPSLTKIDYRDQVTDLAGLLDALNLKGPVHAVGLSYGGGIGIAFASTYPERIATLTSMAPYTEPLAKTEAFINNEVRQTRILFPWNPATDQELYDDFFHQLVYSTYPLAEPIVLSNPFILEAVYNLARGIHPFLAKDFVRNLPDGKFNLMVANQDQYVPTASLETLWSETPASKHASRIFIEGSEHKMPEAIPAFAAKWIVRIVSGDPALKAGHTFYGDTHKNTVSEMAPLH